MKKTLLMFTLICASGYLLRQVPILNKTGLEFSSPVLFISDSAAFRSAL